MLDRRRTGAGGWLRWPRCGVFAGLAVIIVSWPGVTAMAGAGPDANVIVNFGKDLVDPNKYVMPFEVASVMLLAALIGAIYASVERKGGQK